MKNTKAMIWKGLKHRVFHSPLLMESGHVILLEQKCVHQKEAPPSFDV